MAKLTRTERLGICVVCAKRKARRSAGPSCEPCHDRAMAEGTAAQLGVENPKNPARRERVRAYNALIRKGLTNSDIATLWGVKPSTLSSSIRKSAKQVKMKALSSRHVVCDSEPRPASQPGASGRKRNAHGEGWGVHKCFCSPCNGARRHQRKLRDERIKAAKTAAGNEMPS